MLPRSMNGDDIRVRVDGNSFRHIPVLSICRTLQGRKAPYANGPRRRECRITVKSVIRQQWSSHIPRGTEKVTSFPDGTEGDRNEGRQFPDAAFCRRSIR
jgi:hypothetical protein